MIQSLFGMVLLRYIDRSAKITPRGGHKLIVSDAMLAGFRSVSQVSDATLAGFRSVSQVCRWFLYNWNLTYFWPGCELEMFVHGMGLGNIFFWNRILKVLASIDRIWNTFLRNRILRECLVVSKHNEFQTVSCFC